MSIATNGTSDEVVARISPSGLMIQPVPPQAPVGSTRLDERLKAPDRTAATTPTASHLAVVADAVARDIPVTAATRADEWSALPCCPPLSCWLVFGIVAHGFFRAALVVVPDQGAHVRIMSRSHAVRRGLTCLSVLAGVLLAPQKVFGQG